MKRTGSGKNSGKNSQSTARGQTPTHRQTSEPRRSRSPDDQNPPRRSRSPDSRYPESRSSRSPRYSRYSGRYLDEPRRSRSPEPRSGRYLESRQSPWYPENRRMTLNLRSQQEEVPREMDIREENAFLRGRIAELNIQLGNTTSELHELRRNFSDLRTDNHIASQEIDELRKELENLQAEDRPSERQKGKRPVRSGGEPEGRLTKRQKGKKVVRVEEADDDDDDDDDEKARTEMKAVLKTLPKELDLAYDETFTSETNSDILRELVPRIRSSMEPKYNLSYNQVRAWLAALHKHRRVRLLYKERGTLDKDNRRLHRNNRLNEKKARRLKGAVSLILKDDENLKEFDPDELQSILKDNRYHSPEYSESDETDANAKRVVNVYNPSWRSRKLINLLRNVLDPHSLSLQSSQLSRQRNYSDNNFNIVTRHPHDAPKWTYVKQNTPVDTDFSEPAEDPEDSDSSKDKENEEKEDEDSGDSDDTDDTDDTEKTKDKGKKKEKEKENEGSEELGDTEKTKEKEKEELEGEVEEEVQKPKRRGRKTKNQ